MTKAADESKVFQWPNFGPYQPDGEKAMKGTESAGFKPVTIPGDKIMPQTVDPQTIPAGTPGNS